MMLDAVLLLKMIPKSATTKQTLTTGGGAADVPLHVLAALRVAESGDVVRHVRHGEEQGPLHHEQDDAQPGLPSCLFFVFFFCTGWYGSKAVNRRVAGSCGMYVEMVGFMGKRVTRAM